MEMSATLPLLVVVEAYEPCHCHTILVTRVMVTGDNCRTWIVLNVKNPCQASFGDIIDYNKNGNEAYQVRNEKLRFKLQLDNMSAKQMISLAGSLPYLEMYDETNILFSKVG